MNIYENGKIYRLRCLTTGRFYIGSTVRTLGERQKDHEKDFRLYYQNEYGHYISSFKIIQYRNYVLELIEAFPCETERDLQLREGYWQRRFQEDKKLVNVKFIGQTKNEGKRRLKQKLRRSNNYFMDVSFHIELNRLFLTDYDVQQRRRERKEWAKQHHITTYEPEYHTRLNNLFKTTEDLEEEERIRKEKKRLSDANYRAKNLEKVRTKDNEYHQQEDVKEKARLRAKAWRENNVARSKAWQKEKIECECGSIVCRSAMAQHRKSTKHIQFIEKIN